MNKKTNEFLREKLKNIKDVVKNLENDVEKLKTMLVVERQVSQKSQTRLFKLEKDLGNEREKEDKKEDENRLQIRDLESEVCLSIFLPL
jgi:hypothetical protein